MIAAHRRAPSESWRPLTSALEGYPWPVDCLNEIVSVFLIIIPVAETSLSRDWTWRTKRWIAAQALAAPIAFLALEIIVSGYVIAPVAHAESGSHLRMLLFYAGLSDHSMASLHNFSLNWLFFNIAAPAQDALYSIPIWPHYRGYFEPSLVNYLFRPVTVALIVMFALIVMSMDSFESVPTFGVILVICWLRLRLIHWCGGALSPSPPKALLFSPAVTLPHLLLVAVLFTATTVPAKQITLSAFAVLLFLANSTFIFLPTSGLGMSNNE